MALIDSAVVASATSPSVERSDDDRAEVTVRVLGPVDVVGGVRPFTRAWTLDLVVYLAMHPRGSSADVWASALWPDWLPAAPTRHSTVSAARRALGRASDGRDHLPHSRGPLRLGPSVQTDWDRFSALADGRRGPGGPEGWRMALDLVRGRPFEGLRTYDWTVLDGVVTAIEDAIVEVAVRLAEHWLAAGNGRAAELAARRGLVASPFDERLYRALLRAADAQANPAGVEAAMAQLLRLVVGSAGPNTPVTRADPRELDLVHPATATLYRSLSRRCARPLGALGGPARTSTAGSAVAVNSGPLDARGCGEGGCRGY